MEHEQLEFKTFGDLMAKVGTILFYWSQLEQQLACSIRQARKFLNHPTSTIRGGLAERLDLWRQLISKLPENFHRGQTANEVRIQCLAIRDVRNQIVHGLCASDAMPRIGAAHISCLVGGYEEPESEIVRYTIDQLEDLTQGIDACRRAFIDLDNFNYRIVIKETGSLQRPRSPAGVGAI